MPFETPAKELKVRVATTMAKAHSLKGHSFVPAVPTGLVSNMRDIAEKAWQSKVCLSWESWCFLLSLFRSLYVYFMDLYGRSRVRINPCLVACLALPCQSCCNGRGWILRGSSLVQCHLARYKESEAPFTERSGEQHDCSQWHHGSAHQDQLLRLSCCRVRNRELEFNTDLYILKRSWIEVNGQPWDCLKMSEVDMAAGCNASLKGCERASEWQKDGLLNLKFTSLQLVSLEMWGDVCT